MLRWLTEQAVEELLNGNDLDHPVSTTLHPNRVAVGFRLLARNLAIGLQIADAGERPTATRESAAFHAAHVDGLGTFARTDRTIRLTPRQPTPERAYRLPWTRLTVRLAA